VPVTGAAINQTTQNQLKDGIAMNKLKTLVLASCATFLGALSFVGVATPANAQMPGPHPAYVHAISDLRAARGMLQTNWGIPQHAQAASAAVHEIDQAIADLKHASHDDGKNMNDAPPIDTALSPKGRLHKSYDLLKAAHNDASGTESDPFALPSRDHAMRHIDAATAAIAGVL
jgi:hypothetical protein